MPIIVVHGVSVRKVEFAALKERVAEEFANLKVDMLVEGCYWGDLGSALTHGGATIPNFEVTERTHSANFDVFDVTENWQRSIETLLLDDPYFELKALADMANPVLHGISFPLTPDDMEQRSANLERVKAEVHNSLLGDEALALLLGKQQFSSCIENCIHDVFVRAQRVDRKITIMELKEPLIRSMTAALYLCSETTRAPGSLPLAWSDVSYRVNQAVESCLAVSRGELSGPLPTAVLSAIGRAAHVLRNKIMSEYALVLGDALAYHSNRQPIMERLQQTIDSARQQDNGSPLWLIGHSLGGVIAYEFAAQSGENIDCLATIGSQVGLLAELGTLHIRRIPRAMRYQQPAHVRKWLNVYDRNDFLSFLAEPMFTGVQDRLFDTKAPFPLSHEQYFQHRDLYKQLVGFFG